MGISALTHQHSHTDTAPHTHTHKQGMTELPGAVMGEWAVIWRGELGNQERGMHQKKEKV